MIWSIALRNLWQHKSKTLIIGILVTLGIMLTFTGNALIDSVIRNISSIFTDYYTGDILITSSETLGAGVFGAQSDEVYGAPVIPLIREYEQSLKKVEALPGVKSITHQLSGYALFGSDDGSVDFSLFFGIEPENYYQTMAGIEILQGRLLEPGEHGLLLHENQWKDFKDNKDRLIKIGDLMPLTNFGAGGFKIQEVPVVGIFKFPKGNQRTFPMSFLDAGTLRYLLGRSAGTTEKVQVSKQATNLLDADMDSLFAEESITKADTQGSLNSSNVFSILPPETKVAPAGENPQVNWHFIIVRLEKGTDAGPLIARLNKEFSDDGLMSRAQGWWVSAMPDSLTYSGLQILFNIAIFILAFVAVIIIMNTLVVSVMERTPEIGTMRALGAQKSFITKMFIAETGIITLVFGFLGLLLGALVILLFGALGINTDTDSLRYIGGGGILRPSIGALPVFLALGLMAFIALFSWIYPVMIALKVSPLKAITSE